MIEKFKKSLDQIEEFPALLTHYLHFYAYNFLKLISRTPRDRLHKNRTADLLTFTGEILNGKLYFLCSVTDLSKALGCLPHIRLIAELHAYRAYQICHHKTYT